MFLVGIATSILGIFSIAAASLKLQFSRETPARVSVNNPQILYLSVWSIGVGITLAVIGSILASAFAKYTSINATGFGIMLGGICISVLGFGMMLATIKIHNHNLKIVGHKVDRPKFLLPSILSIGFGTVLTIVGSIISRSYAKETIINYTGFGALLIGVAILSAGISQTVIEVLKQRWNLEEYCIGENAPRIVLVSIWAICIGSMLIANGSLIASSYAKSSLINYA